MPTTPLTRTAPPRPPCLSLSSSATTTTSSSPYITLPQRPSFHFSLFSFKPKRFHFLKPCSSLRETKKQQQQTLSKAPSNAPQSLRRILNLNPRGENDENKDGDAAEGDGGGDSAVKGTILAGLLLIGVVGGFGTVGYLYRDQINTFLTQFSSFIEGDLLWTQCPFDGFAWFLSLLCELSRIWDPNLIFYLPFARYIFHGQNNFSWNAYCAK